LPALAAVQMSTVASADDDARILELGSVGIQDSHADLVVIQALDGPIRFD
jgi:hypothetical protein